MRARTPGLRAACLDLDGVIVDSEPLHYEAERRALASHGVSFAREDKLQFVGGTVRETAERMAARYDLPDVEAFLAQRERHFQDLVAHRLQLRSGLVDLLGRLAARGIPRAVVTSGSRRYVSRVLDMFRLRPCFAGIVALEDVSKHKPSAEPYLAAARALGMPAVSCLALEDSPTGIASANGAGMYCVVVPSGATAGTDLSEADERVESLNELDDGFVDRLFSRGDRPAGSGLKD